MKPYQALLQAKPDLNNKKRVLWIYLPSIYFAEGLPWCLVNLVSVIFYSKMGVSNSMVALITANLAWPWTFKMLWSPYIDSYKTKRFWLIFMQFLLGAVFILMAFTPHVNLILKITISSFTLHIYLFLALTIIGFSIIAFLSATNDIAIDGFYMISLDQKQQAFFVGLRSTFYRISLVFGNGFLVFLAGTWELSRGVALSWTYVFIIAGSVLILLALFHQQYLPHYEKVEKNASKRERKKLADIPFVEVFKLYLTQDKVIPILAFLFLYRFGEAMISRILPLFLLNPADQGGLGLSTQSVGLIQGTVGFVSLTVGGIFGGWLIYLFGLRKTIWPMALALNVPNLFYIYLSYTAAPQLSLIYVAVSIEQFGYGLGFSAFLMYLIIASKGRYKTSFYAISTGIMALGLNLPGMVSGFLQEAVGYQSFFIITTLLTIPGMITIFFLPFDKENEPEDAS